MFSLELENCLYSMSVHPLPGGSGRFCRPGDYRDEHDQVTRTPMTVTTQLLLLPAAGGKPWRASEPRGAGEAQSRPVPGAALPQASSKGSPVGRTLRPRRLPGGQASQTLPDQRGGT